MQYPQPKGVPQQSYLGLVQKLAPIKQKLLNHPLYSAVQYITDLQIFMESHAFAVWDFMCLLKSLQKDLAGTDWPWIPPRNIRAARLINEIVLCEESDEIHPGVLKGHFDLYVEAMAEVDANGRPILEFIDHLRNQVHPFKALHFVSIPECTRNFVKHTLTQTQKSTHEKAAAFLFGREDCIPEMFQRIVFHLESSSETMGLRELKHYLRRHIEMDGDAHGPAGALLLQDLCGDDPQKWIEAEREAKSAIHARILLWDGIYQEITKPLNEEWSDSECVLQGA